MRKILTRLSQMDGRMSAWWVVVLLVFAAGMAACIARPTASPTLPVSMATDAPAAPKVADTAAAPTATAIPAPSFDAPAPSAGVGILGDSNSDEYRADDNRGGAYASTTLNWMEQLIKNRGLNFGPWGTWGEPRRTGYKYNWGRSGATAGTMISSGQHTGLAQQVASGEVSDVFVWIGGNDFTDFNGTYGDIYNGILSDTDLQTKIDTIIADVTLAVDTVLKAGKVRMVVVTISDKGMVPDYVRQFSDAAGRQRVTDAINAVNAGLESMAAARGIKVVDGRALVFWLLDHIDAQGFLHMGSEQIRVFSRGNEPHNGQLDDPVGHAGTVLSGLLANELFVKPFNDQYGLDLVPLSDEEILQNAGLTGGSSTGSGVRGAIDWLRHSFTRGFDS